MNSLAIAGDSVGGNMTAVVSLLAKERKGPTITAQVLFYPFTDARQCQFESGTCNSCSWTALLTTRAKLVVHNLKHWMQPDPRNTCRMVETPAARIARASSRQFNVSAAPRKKAPPLRIQP
jgi:hypothetical protein